MTAISERQYPPVLRKSIFVHYACFKAATPTFLSIKMGCDFGQAVDYHTSMSTMLPRGRLPPWAGAEDDDARVMPALDEPPMPDFTISCEERTAEVCAA